MGLKAGERVMPYNDIDSVQTRKRWEYMAGLTDEKQTYPDAHTKRVRKVRSLLKQGGQPGPHVGAKKNPADMTLLTLASYYYCYGSNQSDIYNWVF